MNRQLWREVPVRSRAFFTTLLFCVVPFLAPHTALSQSFAMPQGKMETWLGMYLSDKKVGATMVRMEPTLYKGAKAIKIVSTSSLALQMFGSRVEQNSVQTTYSAPDGRPITLIFDIRSQTSTLHLEANFNYKTKKVVCLVGSGAERATKTLTMPQGGSLVGDTTLLNAGRKVTVGQTFSYYYLDPVTVEFKQAKIQIVGREKVRDLTTGKEVDVFVSKGDLAQAQMTSWETERGDLLRAEMSLGPVRISMQKEPKKRATNMQDIALLPRKGDTYKPPADFAVATAIRTDRPITNPRKLQALDLSISGIPDKDLILSDSWQQVEEQKAEGKGFSARYRVKSVPFDAEKALSLPVTDTQFAPYLAKALPYLDTTNPSIVKTATEVRGEETNLYRIAISLRDWVAKNMIADPSIGVPRTASDIYNNRRGVCRDYSTLFTALARAAGVPTRVCGGIVYAEGRFFYHAWAECYVGEWVTIDPTLHNLKNPVEYTDATHIKFAQGDVMQMFNTVAVVGRLQIKVNDFAPKE